MDAHSPQSNQDYSVCSRESKRTLYSALAEHGSVDAHDQTHVVNFLASASNYGLPGPVECIETANYYLFLSGPYCFKLFRQCPKDAASGEPPRRHSLEERYQLALREIEFGQLYSPKLYLGLVPVWQRDAALFMQVPQTANGEQPSLKHVALQQDVIADWVIVLHRYDASNSFDRFVEHYQPNYIECQKLAHLFEPKSGEEVIDQQGESWLTFLYKSLEDLEPFVRSCDSKTKKNTLRACLNRAKGQLDRSKPAILHREDHGLFRHIHGDVKLSNVVDLRDNFCLINPRVEDEHGAMTELIGDPFYDIAALVGELWSRNLNKQANWVFSHYCSRQFDSHALNGLLTFDLYVFMQSLKAARSLYQKRTITTTNAPQPHEFGFQNHLRTARDSLLQDETRIIAVGGGRQRDRSHFSRMLAPLVGRMPGALYLSAEQEILALYEISDLHCLPTTAHRFSVWELVYRRMADKARLALAAGYSVIMEGWFGNPVNRQQLSDLASDFGLENSLIAFNLVQSRNDMKKAIDGGDSRNSNIEMQSANGPDSGSDAFAMAGIDHDWTRWIELDCSRSVGDQLGKALNFITIARASITREILH